MKLLLVDDHLTFRTMATRMLAGFGHDVVAVADAPAARAAFIGAAEPFDVVVTDVFLDGGATGLQLVEELEKTGRELRVLFMSGDDLAGQLPELQRPRRRFILKPFLAHEIQTALQALLGS